MYFSNCMHKLNKMLIVALAAMGFASAKAQTTLPGSIQEAVKENVNAKAVMENIMTRTSIRKFKQQPVEDAKIEALLRAGMAAPTANDMQPWHFVVLKDKQDIEKYAESNKYHAEDIKKTPLFIFVCADTTRMAEGQGTELWVQDLSAVSEYSPGSSCHGIGSLLDNHLSYPEESEWHFQNIEFAWQSDSTKWYHHRLS